MEAQKYTKKPVEIEAIQWLGENLVDVIDFTGLHESAKKWTWDQYEEVVRTEGLKIFTLEGTMNADLGDYIIKGVKGEFYPCKPEIFELTYSPSQPSEQKPQERAEDLEAEFEKLFVINGHRFGYAVEWKDVFNWAVSHAQQEREKAEKELFDYKSLAKNYRTENYQLLELIKSMKTNAEFSEDYIRNGMSYPTRGKDENISNVFNGPILAFWLETNQCQESELSEEQKKYAGLN